MNCFKCGAEVGAREGWREVSGWAEVRAQGGTNAVAFQKPLGRVACNGCIIVEKTRRKAGVHPQQATFG